MTLGGATVSGEGAGAMAAAGKAKEKEGFDELWTFLQTAGNPRSGRRIAVLQPALERTRTPPDSAVFAVPSPPLSSRGALKALHNTVFPPSCRRIQRGRRAT